MKLKLLAAIAGLALIASPAFAGSTTVEFANAATGQSTVVVFNTDGTAKAGSGAPVAYTMDNDAKKICSTYQDKPICVTFGDIGKDVGFTTSYSDDQGNSGTATITAVEP